MDELNRKRTVLLIDDSDEDRETYKRYLLREEGIAAEIIEASTGAQGLARIEKHAGRIDCILLDLSLPDVDGVELLNTIMQRKGGAPGAIIMLTGTGNEMIAVKSMKDGALDYLVKSDVTASVLQQAVAQAVRRFDLQYDLEESEERTRLVLNNLPVMVFALDSKGVFTFADGSGMAPLALKKDAILGVSAFEVFAAEPKVVEQIQRTLAGEQTSWNLSSNDREFEAHCSVKRDFGGLADGVYGVVLDVTQRKQAEDALKHSKRRIEAILGGITDAYICLGRDWRITDMNGQAEQAIFCRAKHELIGESAWTEYPDVATSVWYSRFEQAMREGNDAHFEAKSALNGHWYEAHIYPDDDGLSVYLTDISERKRAETELSRLYQREHRIAETLQRSLLSSASDGIFHNFEVDTVYKSAKDEAKVGGDFYDIFSLRDNKVAMVVGDVSGKGLDAASHTAEVKYTLRAYLREYPGPAVALRRLNHYLALAQETEEGFRKSFVCVSLIVVDTFTGECETAMAGAEPPAIIRASGEIEPLRIASLPLACDADAEYESIKARLDAGDTLMLTTDGLTEARRDGHFLGLEGVAAIARSHRATDSLQEIGRLVLSDAERYAGGSLQDDACLLLARRKVSARMLAP